MKKILFFIISLLFCNYVHALETLLDPYMDYTCGEYSCVITVNFDPRADRLEVYVNNQLATEFTSFETNSGSGNHSGFEIYSPGVMGIEYLLGDSVVYLDLEVRCYANDFEPSVRSIAIALPALAPAMDDLEAPIVEYTFYDEAVVVTIAPTDPNTEKIFYRITYGDNVSDWMEYNSEIFFDRPIIENETTTVLVEAYAVANGYNQSVTAGVFFVLSQITGVVPDDPYIPGTDPDPDPVDPDPDPADPIPDPTNPTDTGDTNSNTLAEEPKEEVKNPLTGDNVLVAFIGLLVSMGSIIILNRIKKKISI